MKSTSGSEAMLTPDNKAVVPSQGTIRTMAVDAADYILWTKGILPLNNGTVGDIIDDLGRYYDVKIVCGEDIRQIRITGKIDLQRWVEEALRNLSLTGGFVYSKQAEAYVLRLTDKD